MTCLYFLPPRDAKKKDLVYCNIRKGLPHLTNSKLGGLCEQWDLGMIPAWQWSSNKQCMVELCSVVPCGSQVLLTLCYLLRI